VRKEFEEFDFASSFRVDDMNRSRYSSI